MSKKEINDVALKLVIKRSAMLVGGLMLKFWSCFSDTESFGLNILCLNQMLLPFAKELLKLS